eukprot:207144-Chlamydomonas_euryale.AAC.7
MMGAPSADSIERADVPNRNHASVIGRGIACQVVQRTWAVDFKASQRCLTKLQYLGWWQHLVWQLHNQWHEC